MYTNECLYKDVYIIIEMMDDKMKNKINNNFIEFLKENQDVNFCGTINKEIPLKEQHLRKEIKLMLSQMYIDYFCNQEEKKEILAVEKNNIENFYNRDIFEREQTQENISREKIENTNVNNNLNMIKYKENIFTKILKLIKKLKKS